MDAPDRRSPGRHGSRAAPLNDVFDIALFEEGTLATNQPADPRSDRSQQRDVRVAVALLRTRHEPAQVLVRGPGSVHRTSIVTFRAPAPNTPFGRRYPAAQWIVDEATPHTPEEQLMNTRYLIASALAATIVAPVALS